MTFSYLQEEGLSVCRSYMVHELVSNRPTLRYGGCTT
jgi:hypothetical protein